MGVNAIGTNGYPADYKAWKTERNQTEDNTANTSWTVKAQNHDMVLHGEESEEDGKAVTAWACVTDHTSMTVYQPKDFDPAHPVYKVKVWDADGNVTERMVDISKVDPGNCDTVDMYAYSAYLSKSGKCPDALTKFMMAHAHYKDMRGESGAGNLSDKVDWLEIIEKVMKMQYDAGNLQGYLEYKKFLSVLTEEKEAYGKKGQDGKTEESKTETDVQVKPDGSRALVITRAAGGIVSTSSIELSRPSKLADEPEETGETGKKGWTAPDISSVSGQLFGE